MRPEKAKGVLEVYSALMNVVRRAISRTDFFRFEISENLDAAGGLDEVERT
jgi:hypothetical protein